MGDCGGTRGPAVDVEPSTADTTRLLRFDVLDHHDRLASPVLHHERRNDGQRLRISGGRGRLSAARRRLVGLPCFLECCDTLLQPGRLRIIGRLRLVLDANVLERLYPVLLELREPTLERVDPEAERLQVGCQIRCADGRLGSDSLSVDGRDRKCEQRRSRGGGNKNGAFDTASL
jgi:hypothetical protein